MTGDATCPRCGQPATPQRGPFCPHCGRYLPAPGGAAGRDVTLRWVAVPPGGGAAPPPTRAAQPYAGPPRYPAVPRWGFRPGPWLAAGADAAAAPDPLDAARGLASTTVPLLWATAVTALVAAGAEAWRYGLLLASRGGALSADAVAASDALVLAAGTVAPLLGVLAGALVIAWSVRAGEAAAQQANVRGSRRRRDVVLGWLVPGLNLGVPGAVLAEIEHTALGRPPAARPRPSRLVLGWWALWAGSVLLAAVVLVWSRRDGVQALADGVVLHAGLDVLAAVTAGWTAVLVGRLTRLLGPATPGRREVVRRIDAPAPVSSA